MIKYSGISRSNHLPLTPKWHIFPFPYHRYNHRNYLWHLALPTFAPSPSQSSRKRSLHFARVVTRLHNNYTHLFRHSRPNSLHSKLKRCLKRCSPFKKSSGDYWGSSNKKPLMCRWSCRKHFNRIWRTWTRSSLAQRNCSHKRHCNKWETWQHRWSNMTWILISDASFPTISPIGPSPNNFSKGSWI